MYLMKKRVFCASSQNVLNFMSEANYGGCNIAPEDYNNDGKLTRIINLIGSTRNLLFVNESFRPTKQNDTV